jgi:hypothetical protein
MQTTLDIPKPLLDRAKAAATNEGRSLSEFITDVLADRLSDPQPAAASPSTDTAAPFVMPVVHGGTLPEGFDPSSNSAWEDLFLEEARDPKTGEIDINKLK